MFSLGEVLGGVTSATALVVLAPLFGWLSASISLALLVVAAVILTLRDLTLIRFPLPEARRLVPRTVFNRTGWVAALQFGFELGTGVRTYISASAPYLLALAVLLASSLGASSAIVAGAAFGIGRAAMILFRSWSRDESGWDLKMARALVWIPTAALAQVSVAVLWTER